MILIMLFLSSCALTKRKNKKEVQTQQTEEIVQQTTRQGDTVTFYVPRMVLKDTTVYSVNRVGTRIETRYDTLGRLD